MLQLAAAAARRAVRHAALSTPLPPAAPYRAACSAAAPANEAAGSGLQVYVEPLADADEGISVLSLNRCAAPLSRRLPWPRWGSRRV